MRILVNYIWIPSLLIAFGNTALSQSTNNEKHSFRMSWDNDFLNFRGDGTDRYYTNGIRFDYFYTKQKKAKFPSSLLLNISQENDNIYGWGLAQFMFTPKNIDLTEIQYNDRPYAGALYSIHSLESTDTTKKIRITTEIFLGVIGPISFADEAQTWAHRVIGYTKPRGWPNQVSNDIILNYNISLERQMVHYPNKISVSGIVETFSGTLYNAAGAGFMLRAGKCNTQFQDLQLQKNKSGNRYQLYVFMKPVIRAVLSNSLLQGGLISQLSDNQVGYTLSKDQIERVVVLYDVGLVYARPKWSILISQKFRTAEFEGQYTQEFGNITVWYKL
tara:strand:- start:80858 stop:81850 length:993 start_codon:yes stop_codon:yes gene_type:complete